MALFCYNNFHGNFDCWVLAFFILVNEGGMLMKFKTFFLRVLAFISFDLLLIIILILIIKKIIPNQA
jgi:hypothetical protein